MSSAPTEPAEPAARQKFVALDGLRGVAALAVLFWHGHSFLDVSAPGSAYLAVDLFFLMSGFVVAYSYEDKLRSGMTFAAFTLVRLRRLYPLYLLGTAILAIFFLISTRMEGYAGDSPPLLMSFGFGVFMLPAPSSDPIYYLFPLSPAAWSLFLEIIINLVYAALLRWLSVRIIVIVTAVSAVWLGLVALGSPTLDLGWNWATLMHGVPRVVFSFSLGVLMYRLRDRLPQLRIPTPVTLAAALLFLCIPAGFAWTSLAAFAVILVGFPVIVAAVVQNEPVRFRAVYLFLGAVSYPLYILHHGFLRWLNGAAAAFGYDLEHMPLLSYAMLPVIVVLAWAALKLFDEPVRAALGRISKRAARRRQSAA